MNTLWLGLLFWGLFGALVGLLIGRYMRMPRPDDACDAASGDTAAGASARTRQWPTRLSS